MSKKSRSPRRGAPRASVATEAVPEGDVLGDLVAPGFDVEVADDGKVRIHARCDRGDDPAACAGKVRFLVEALGAELVAPPELPR